MFEELVPSVSPLLKKENTRLGHAGIVDHSVDLSIPDLLKKKVKKKKKGWQIMRYFLMADREVIVDGRW